MSRYFNPKSMRNILANLRADPDVQLAIAQFEKKPKPRMKSDNEKEDDYRRLSPERRAKLDALPIITSTLRRKV